MRRYPKCGAEIVQRLAGYPFKYRRDPYQAASKRCEIMTEDLVIASEAFRKQAA